MGNGLRGGRSILCLTMAALLVLVLSGVALSVTRYGGGGNDRLRGGPGNDELVGYAGRDKLIGRGGSDDLHGGPDRDRLRGGQGRDVAEYIDAKRALNVNLRRGSGGGDRLGDVEGVFGGPESDVLLGERGGGTFNGRDGRDRVNGRGGDDTIYAWDGRDKVRGGSGRDWIFADGGGKTLIRCGPGKDSVSADRRDRLRDCERKFR